MANTRNGKVSKAKKKALPKQPKRSSGPAADMDWEPPETITSNPLSNPVSAGSHVSIDSDPITPPPAAKHSGKRAAASINDSDSADEKPAPKKKKNQKEPEAKPDPNRKLVVYIPAGGDAIQRKNVTHTTSFEDLLDEIYEIVGCTDVSIKPKLSYKLSTASPKAAAISLSTETDWEGCLDEVTTVERNKKGNVSVSVHIIVSEQYLVSLLANKGKTLPSRKKQGKLQILDLEHAGSDDDDFDDGVGIMAKEAKHMEQLQKMYSHCQMCGPMKVCKISAAGGHQPLSNNHLRGWSRSLAAETHGVTLQSPPKAAMFAMFFKNFGANGPAAPTVQPQSPFGAMNPLMGVNPFGFMAPWMQGVPPAFGGNTMTSALAYGTPSTSVRTSTVPASSPRASGSSLSATLPSNEISKLGTAAELIRLFGMSDGNASFLFAQVKLEMKRVDRIIRAARA
ncbi:hypothetical protein B0H17DRAFT_1093638 [Mycena rosella]|uniref:Uncharacterized protein n=1 Tax=Mycena rosella TaxID=1033263 RepID=A0AAD7G761_MYCRO|nr:hypothetical protein B0H17DRAFT_1093638 [Mycena rosella]